jgi:chromosome condensin MukBEF MukE localization factor
MDGAYNYMNNSDTQITDYQHQYGYEFLNTERAKKYFADVDFALRSGRHIQNFGNDFKLWDFINDYFDKGLAKYYLELLGMVLKKEFNEREAYFFLDFPEDGSKGKFGYDRTYALDDRLIIFAILLLNLYKEKFFENKEVKWNELLYIIEEGENKDLWQKLLYGENKRNFTPAEKEEVKRKIERTLQVCERLGWIRWLNYDDLHFEIMPSIDRIAKLYANEINNVEVLTEYLDNNLLS